MDHPGPHPNHLEDTLEKTLLCNRVALPDNIDLPLGMPQQTSLYQTGADPKPWTRTLIWLSPENEGDSSPLACIVQPSNQPEQVPSFRFQILDAKSGIFATVWSPRLKYILMPGSRLEYQGQFLSLSNGSPPLATPTDQLAPLPQRSPTPAQGVTHQAMILGAGLASRFVPVSGDWTGLPKPGVPLVGEDSVIVTLARHLQRHGITRLLVNTYYRPEVIKEQLATVAGLEVMFIDEAAPSGTAGGLVKALEQGLVDRSRPILILQGDAVTDADLSELLISHQDHPSVATIGVKRIADAQVNQLAIVATDQSAPDGQSGFVQFFKEKPSLAEAGPHRLGSIGFYVLSPQAYEGFVALGKQCWQKRSEYDYAMDYLPSLLPGISGIPYQLYAHTLSEPFYWSDIGRPDQYLASLRDLYSGRLQLPLPAHGRHFFDQDVAYWGQARRQVEIEGVHLTGPAIVFENVANHR
jgi:NDP-sugar pyrophosphorylase family protein